MKEGGKKKRAHGTISNIYGEKKGRMKMKKLFSMLTALALMFSLCIPAFAADPADKYVVGHVFTQEDMDRFWTVQPSERIARPVTLNRNTTGAQGTGCGYFTAHAQAVTVVLTNATGALPSNG